MKSNIDSATPLPVLVPKQAGYLGIAKGSAIVLVRREDGFHMVYYEGNIFGAENLETITGRLQVAASRGLTRAPTTAFMGMSEKDLKAHFDEIGTYQYSTNTLLESCEARSIWSQWLDGGDTCAN